MNGSLHGAGVFAACCLVVLGWTVLMATATHDERERWQGPIALTFTVLLLIFTILGALREVAFRP